MWCGGGRGAGFSACRVRGTDGEVCLLSSMCRKLEAKRDDEGKGSAPVTLPVSCRSEGSRDSGERSPLCRVTPGSGRGRPFCSRSCWGPGKSTHPVCRMTWGKESPERGKKKTQKGQYGNTLTG